MGTKKISELNEATSINSDDLIPIVDNENESTKKIKFKNFQKNIYSYSMEEVKIGTWVNGKPLYRKILNVELPIYDSTSSYGGINRYTYATDVDIVTKLYGYIKTSPNVSGDTNWLSFPIFNASSGSIISLIDTIDNTTNNTHEVAIFNRDSSYNSFWGFVVVEYTKTTD